MTSLLFQREAGSAGSELHEAVLGVACDLADAPAPAP